MHPSPTANAEAGQNCMNIKAIAAPAFLSLAARAGTEFRCISYRRGCQDVAL
jgi:hypothetical protein